MVVKNRKEYMAQYLAKPGNLKKYKEYMSNYRTNHKDKFAEYKRKHYILNTEKVRKRSAEYHRVHRNNPEYKLKCKVISDRNHAKTKGTPSVRLWHYKGNARVKNIEFSLTFEQFESFWQKPCYYCGMDITTIGLDRVDNAKGYTIDNVVPCCEWCNRQKLGYTQEEFIDHAKRIAILKRD
jgi:hypothetical protein